MEQASDDERADETPSSGRRLQQASEDDWIRQGDADEAARIAAEEKAARDHTANEAARIAAEAEAARVAEELVEAQDARIAAAQHAADLARIAAEEEEQEELAGEVERLSDDEHADETPSSGRRSLLEANHGDSEKAALAAAEEKVKLQEYIFKQWTSRIAAEAKAGKKPRFGTKLTGSAQHLGHEVFVRAGT